MLPSFGYFYDELYTTVSNSVVLSFWRQRNYIIQRFQVKLKSTNLTLKLAIKTSASCPFDINSYISIRYFISTVKTNLFLLISSTLVSLSIAPLSCTNYSVFDSITIITQQISLQRTKTLEIDL